MMALPLVFASPWVLFALAALPILWWLLRVTPPAPRREVFPAVRLLLGLTATAETPARTPWWLLALRILAAALVIVGLARPVLDAGAALPGTGPVLLVIDNGWAAADRLAAPAWPPPPGCWTAPSAPAARRRCWRPRRPKPAPLRR